MYSLFEYDYCFCGNPDNCPKKDTCRRALRVSGIHSYSEFYVEGKECEYYWEVEKENKNNE